MFEAVKQEPLSPLIVAIVSLQDQLKGVRLKPSTCRPRQQQAVTNSQRPSVSNQAWQQLRDESAHPHTWTSRLPSVDDCMPMQFYTCKHTAWLHKPAFINGVYYIISSHVSVRVFVRACVLVYLWCHQFLFQRMAILSRMHPKWLVVFEHLGIPQCISSWPAKAETLALYNCNLDT